MKKSILGIIPARGGSKGIKGKNILYLIKKFRPDLVQGLNLKLKTENNFKNLRDWILIALKSKAKIEQAHAALE